MSSPDITTSANVASLDQRRGPVVTLDPKGNLILPPKPRQGDLNGQLAWLTAVFNLDPRHPVTSAERQGLRGPDGHVLIRRLDAPSIRFEPASRINAPARLIETLSWTALPTDGETLPIKAKHCQQIAHVIRMLCGTSEAMTDEQETAGLIGAFMQSAELVERCTTYGTSAQRYEAAEALSPQTDPNGRPVDRRYLRDENTGEIVVRVGDLNDLARRYIGGSVARGWLDGRMEGLGWERVTLDGHALPGRDGRHGPHMRCHVYRGHLPAESVTT